MTDAAVQACTVNALEASKKSKDPTPVDGGADLYDEEEYFLEFRNSILCRTQSSFTNKFSYGPIALDEKPKLVHDTKNQGTNRYLVRNPTQEDMVIDVVRRVKTSRQSLKYSSDNNLWEGHGDALHTFYRDKLEAKSLSFNFVVDWDRCRHLGKGRKRKQNSWHCAATRATTREPHRSLQFSGSIAIAKELWCIVCITSSPRCRNVSG